MLPYRRGILSSSPNIDFERTRGGAQVNRSASQGDSLEES